MEKRMKKGIKRKREGGEEEKQEYKENDDEKKGDLTKAEWEATKIEKYLCMFRACCLKATCLLPANFHC